MPRGELKINGYDAYQMWGVSLEDQAIAALMTPHAMKEDITNQSRLEHGTRHWAEFPKVAQRDLTLPIHLVARSKNEYLRKYASFCEELRKGKIDIETSYEPNVVHHCLYQSCTQFTQFYGGIAKMVLKLVEPNPMDTE